jgi:dihydrofolate reductase
MRRVQVLMFMTIDGVAEMPDYGEDPRTPTDDEINPLWTPRIESVDTLLLGRRTYEKWAAFWPGIKSDPSATEWNKRFSRFADAAEKVVFSKTLKSAEWANSRIVRGDPASELARLRARPGKDIAVAGPRLVQSFLAAGLADDLLLGVFPSIVGRGKPLFRVAGDPDHQEDVIPLGASGRQDFELVESRGLSDGALFVHYRRIDPSNPTPGVRGLQPAK